MEQATEPRSPFVAVTALLLVAVCATAFVRFWLHKEYIVTVSTSCDAMHTCETVTCDDIYTQTNGCTPGEDISVYDKVVSGQVLDDCAEDNNCREMFN